MYARPVRQTVRLTLSALVVVASLVLAGCSAPDPSAQARSLCTDLANLRGTIDFLAVPPPGTSVGEVRGALDKLDPTFGSVSSSGLVPTSDMDALVAAHEDYRDVIGRVGDDDLFETLAAQGAGPAAALGVTFAAVMRDLGCAVATPVG